MTMTKIQTLIFHPPLVKETIGCSNVVYTLLPTAARILISHNSTVYAVLPHKRMEIDVNVVSFQNLVKR